MQHCGTKTLETDRLILRKFKVDVPGGIRACVAQQEAIMASEM